MSEDEQKPILIGTGPSNNLDLGYRVKCFATPRIQFPCNAPIGIRPDTVFEFPASFPSASAQYPRWYTVKTSAFSIERSSADPGPIPPSRDSDLLGGDFSAGALKLELTDGENNKFLVDLAQGRDLSIVSRGLTARIEAPPGSQRVENTTLGLVVPAGGPFPFYICDVLVNVSIMDGGAPLGASNATLSRLYQVTGVGGDDTFRIPARAQRVQFSVFAPFGVVTPIARFATNLTSPAPARIVYSSATLDALTVTTTGFIDVPGDASSIDLSVSGLVGTIMAVWELSW